MSDTARGWECPRCGVVNGPHVSQCACAPQRNGSFHPVTEQPVRLHPLGCTCGTAAVCPVHPVTMPRIICGAFR